MRPLSISERRFLAKVRNRRSKGMTWQEIADDLKEPYATVYQKYTRLKLKEMELSKAVA